MPYLPGKLPYRGWITDSPYTNVPDGYSADIWNILPADPFRRRIRLGTRPAMNRVYKFASHEIQGMFRCIAYNGSPPVRKDRIIIVAGGRVWWMDATSVSPTQVTVVNGTSGVTGAQLNTTGRVDGVQLGRYLYLVDTTFTSTTAGGVSTPSAYWKVDLQTSGLTLTYWHHSGANRGPEDDVKNLIGSNYYYAQSISKYGARIVLSGVKGIENIWFMSDVDNPEHWQAAAPTDDGNAIAGNVADQTLGPAGDEIIASIPLGESGLLFASKRSLTYLNIDPAVDPNNARLNVMSNTIGIVGPKAWCEGPEKSVYMLGQDGLYRLRPNEFAVDRGNLVSLNKLDSWFNQLRFDLLDVKLHYDIERRGVWIWLTRTDGPENSTHLFYSEQTDGFFPVRLYDPQIPGASYACQSATADGRNQIMLCAYGSMIGFFDQRLVSGVDGLPASGYTDASAAGPTTEADKLAQMIDARMSVGPMLAAQPSLVMIKEIQIELGIDDYLEPSSVVGLADNPYAELVTAETAMEAIAQDDTALLFEETTETIDGNATGSTIDGNSGSAAYDGQYARRAAGAYATQDTSVALTSRKYYNDNNSYVFERISFGSDTRWVIRWANATTVNGASGQPVLFAQVPVSGFVAVSSDDPEIGTYHLAPDGAFSSTTVVTGTVSRNDFVGSDLTELGDLQEGMNNRMRVRKRAGAAYIKIRSTGYPFAIERVAALVDPISTRRTVTEIT